MITPCQNTLHDWLESIKLKITAEKLRASVFTVWFKETKFNQHLTINNSSLPVKSKVKVMGVTFDSKLDFGEHVRSSTGKLQKHKMIIKNVAGSDGGCTKETLFRD